MALLTVEVEYVDVGSWCAQIIWLKQKLSHTVLKLTKVPLMFDNTGATNLTKNLVQHYKTKHIEIRYHFIRDHVNNGCGIKFV